MNTTAGTAGSHGPPGNLRNVRPMRQLDRRLRGQQNHERGECRPKYLGIDAGTQSFLDPNAEQQCGYRQNG
jgi:hypothetical protein